MTESDERAFLGQLRSEIVGLASGTVIEVGAGTGRNFPHYREGLVRELKAVEPDPYMLRQAMARAAAAGLPIELLIEHIRSDHVWRARLQDLVTPLWRRVAANCHPNRPTLKLFRDAGFEVQEMRRHTEGLFPWIPPIVAGVATTRDE